MDVIYKIGDCGDAISLKSCGDKINAVEHRPFTRKGDKTPVGLCTDAPLLILYSERNTIDWTAIFEKELENGLLRTGVEVKIIQLSDSQYSKLIRKRSISIEELKKLFEV